MNLCIEANRWDDFDCKSLDSPQELIPQLAVAPVYGLTCLSGHEVEVSLCNPSDRLRLQVAIFYKLGSPPLSDHPAEQLGDHQTFALNTSRLIYRLAIISTEKDEAVSVIMNLDIDGVPNPKDNPPPILLCDYADSSEVRAKLRGISLEFSHNADPRITVVLNDPNVQDPIKRKQLRGGCVAVIKARPHAPPNDK